MTILLYLLIATAALLGAPLFLVISSLALVGFWSLGTRADILASLIEPIKMLSSQDIFLAIPLFTFAGFLMAAAGTPRRLVNLSRAVLGWMPGGIAVVALVACAFFTAFTGASGVTIIALGGLLYPILIAERYPENFSLGLMTTGGSRGLIFPPSLPLILYATIAAMNYAPLMEEKRSMGPPRDWLTSTQVEPTARSDGDEYDELDALLGGDDDKYDELDALLGDDSPTVAHIEPPAPKSDLQRFHPMVHLNELVVRVDRAMAGELAARHELWVQGVDFERRRSPTPEKLFMAGAIPGAMMVILIALYAMFVGVRRGVPRTSFGAGALARSIYDAAFEIPIPLIILVGIYGGFFTAQEAAGVTAFYVLFVETVIYRDISFKRLPKVMLDSMILVGGVMIILITALALKNYLVLAEIPQTLRDTLTAHITNPLTFLILLNLFLLVVGCMMDIFSAIMVVVPLIIPLAVAYDVHPVHLGVIFLINLEIGYSTPPVGINLFIASLRFRKPVLQLYAACLPFLVLLLSGLVVITYWPGLSLWLMRMSGME